MKKLDSSHSAKQPQKRLVLHRETLRRLDAAEMEQAAGGATAWFTCDQTKLPNLTTGP